MIDKEMDIWLSNDSELPVHPQLSNVYVKRKIEGSSGVNC